jgi:hypothetical protein
MPLDKLQNNIEENFNKLLNSKIFYGILIIAIVLYLQIVKVNVNPKMSLVLNSNFFRLFMFTIIAYLTTKNIAISLIIAIGFISLLIILKQQKFIENFSQINSFIDINTNESKPLKQPGLFNKPKCDIVNKDTKPSFDTTSTCLSYSSEVEDYKL